MARAEMDKDKAQNRPVILIVDDDLALLDKLQQALREAFTVRTATSGVEAIHLLKTPPDTNVLIVSEDLPRMKGTELLRILHEMFKKSESMIKILVTERDANGTVIDLVNHGRIDCCCSKPLDPAAIRRKINYLIAQRSREKRTSMRIPLGESPDFRVETASDDNAKVVNLSENGMFLRTPSFLPEGSSIPLKITLPDGRQYSASGRIVRQDLEHGGVGLEFDSLEEENRDSILQFLANYVTLKDLSELKHRYPFLKTDEMVQFTDTLKIESLLREALERNVEIVAIHAQTRNREILTLADLNPPSTCALHGEKLNIKFKTSDLLFVSFHIGYATYNFETIVSRISADGRSLVCLYPRVMFYSEKRTTRRIAPPSNLYIEINLPVPFEKSVRGTITDISPEGVSFLVDASAPLLLAGSPLESVRILEGDQLLWEEKGEVRNVTRIGADGHEQLRYGVQFGIARKFIRTSEIPSFEARAYKDTKAGRIDLPAAEKAPQKRTSLDELARRPPDVIRMENKLGEEIVGLLNTSLPLGEDPVPVVIIPPAFGKTKEILFALALTLISNFHLQNKPIAVLRYDGIRRKGESHKDPEATDPPYEMTNATLTQAADDIKTVLDWLDLNPRLQPGKVTLVTFSLSALEARILLRDQRYREKVHYWIPCMGTPELRHLLTQVNCGLDLLEQYQLGIKLGIIPVLGNLVNIDRYMEDSVLNQVTTLDQARQDMRQFDLPITWIYGEHDHWVKHEFIRDIMGIKANAEREVISIPLGHNARTSEDALRMFGTLTSLIYRFLYDEPLKPVIPPRSNLEFIRIAEKDRIPARKLKDREGYWERYLIGDVDLMGFDVLLLADDYQQLMDDQVQALQLEPEDRLLDLGGGTGNLVEHLLANRSVLPSEITIADLVPQALLQATKKLGPKLARYQGAPRLNSFVLDLELNRYHPVRRFLAGEFADFRQLLDRIENLTIQSATKIQENYSPRLHRILRGEKILPALEEWLKRTFDLPEYKTIHDFNSAARYVRGIEREKPAYRQLIFPDSLTSRPTLPVREGYYDKILMSLVLSYIFNPVETLIELKRILKPGGLLVLSSLLPDADGSGLFTRLARKVEVMDEAELPKDWNKKTVLASVRSFMNDAQALVDLEEAGTFDFFDPTRLENHLEEAGFSLLQTIETFGVPPQGYIFVAGVKNGREI